MLEIITFIVCNELLKLYKISDDKTNHTIEDWFNAVLLHIPASKSLSDSDFRFIARMIREFRVTNNILPPSQIGFPVNRILIEERSTEEFIRKYLYHY